MLLAQGWWTGADVQLQVPAPPPAPCSSSAASKVPATSTPSLSYLENPPRGERPRRTRVPNRHGRHRHRQPLDLPLADGFPALKSPPRSARRRGRTIARDRRLAKPAILRIIDSPPPRPARTSRGPSHESRHESKRGPTAAVQRQPLTPSRSSPGTGPAPAQRPSAYGAGPPGHPFRGDRARTRPG